MFLLKISIIFKFCQFYSVIILILFLFSTNLVAQEIDSLALTKWPADYVLDSLIISGDTHFPVQTVQNELGLNSYLQNTIDPFKVEQIIDKIIEYYTDLGFPFSKVAVKKIIVDDSLKTVSLSLYINHDKITTISFIKYAELKSNQVEVLNRQARFKVPFIFSRKILDAGDQYLFATELFTDYPRWQIVQDANDNFGVNYELSEEKYNSLDAVLGYTDDGSINSGTRGKLELSFKNLFGSMRQLKLNWQRESKNDESINLYYKEPWVMNFPLSLALSFMQNFQDKEYLERYYSINGDYQLNYTLNLLADFSYCQIIPDSVLIEQGDQKVSKQVTTVGLAYKKSNRSKEFFSSEVKLASALKQFEDGREDHGFKLACKNEWRKKISGPFFIQQQLGMEYTGADTLFLYDLLKLGGQNSLRGYFEDQFRTDMYMLNRNDLIWEAVDNTELFVFCDAAYYDVKGRYKEEYNMKLLVGSGGGLRFNTNLGTFEISYGLAVDEGFDTAKLHFRYKNEF